MSKIFGMVLLLGLAGAVLVSLGILIFEWINSSNDMAKPTPTPKTGSLMVYYQLPQDYGLVDARQLA